MKDQKVWFVTGASKGLGLCLVKQLLKKGFRVAATSRKVYELTSAVGQTYKGQFLPLAMDITSEQSVAEAINKSISYFGHIDVVVNNAGYGLLGSIEELTDAEARNNFDVNVFGSLNVLRQAIPHLRGQLSGQIFNISSIGGFTGHFSGWGIYCATKFAVQGFTESLAAEVKEFGIKVTIVSPGYFRTSFLEGGSMMTPQNGIDAYKQVRESQQAHQESINGNQPGDPEKAVAAIIATAEIPNPPLHLFLGQDAYDLAHAKMKAVKTELETWKAVTISTGF